MQATSTVGGHDFDDEQRRLYRDKMILNKAVMCHPEHISLRSMARIYISLCEKKFLQPNEVRYEGFIDRKNI